MAKIANPWFDDLPQSFQTEERKYIKISSAAKTTADIIISNGSPVTRLNDLEKTLKELTERYRLEEKTVELVFAQCWSSKKRHSATMPELMDTVKKARKARDSQKTLFQHITFILEVIWDLENHLELPLTRAPEREFSQSNGLHRDELVC